MLDVGNTFGPGHKLDDRVELLELIGKGSMGSVYKAQQQGVERAVAVKTLHPHFLFDRDKLARFFREAKAISTLDHPNIVRVYAVGMAGELQPYFLMDYIEGATLADLIKENKLSARDFLELFIQVCAALDHAHRKEIVHRDVKPRNILIQRDALGRYLVKLVDFGIARINETEPGQRITKTGAIIGSQVYMSPEQCTGREVDHRTDIYSLGCVMYEAATGVVPFTERDPVGLIGKHVYEIPKPITGITRIAGLPKAVGDVIAICLEKKPDMRYQDAATLMKDLQAIRDDLPPPFASTASTSKVRYESPGMRTTKKYATIVIVLSMFGVAAFFGARAAGINWQANNSYSKASAVADVTKMCTEAAFQCQRHRFPSALSIYSNAYDICRANGINDKLYADVCAGRARCEMETGNYNSANKYYLIALKYYSLFDMNNTRAITNLKRDWGRSQWRGKEYESAADHLLAAYEGYKTEPLDNFGRVILMRELTESLVAAGKLDTALTLFPERVSGEKNYPMGRRIQVEGLESYAKALNEVGRTKEAKEQLKLAAALRKQFTDED